MRDSDRSAGGRYGTGLHPLDNTTHRHEGTSPCVSWDRRSILLIPATTITRLSSRRDAMRASFSHPKPFPSSPRPHVDP